jgi:NAD-dependent dihydropyrimidine dehydrogenase PreA subunit/uncharacterized low-complexity protein
MVTVKIDLKRCTGCGTCVDVCPEKVFEMQEGEGKKVPKVVAEDRCSACRACEVRCPERATEIAGFEILKVDPPPEYPPEEGRFLRGNDYSPVAVVAILDTYDFKIPPELARLVEVAVESGAALAGTLQTENIGIEKIVANVVANPNSARGSVLEGISGASSSRCSHKPCEEWSCGGQKADNHWCRGPNPLSSKHFCRCDRKVQEASCYRKPNL